MAHGVRADSAARGTRFPAGAARPKARPTPPLPSASRWWRRTSWSVRRGGVAVLLLGLPLAASACGNANGTALAKQACGHVEKALHLLSAAGRPSTDAATATQDRAAAVAELRVALPIAAQAAAEAAQFAPLATTLSETNRVAATVLVPALSQQCFAASTGFFAPAPSGATGAGVPPPGAQTGS